MCGLESSHYATYTKQTLGYMCLVLSNTCMTKIIFKKNVGWPGGGGARAPAPFFTTRNILRATADHRGYGRGEQLRAAAKFFILVIHVLDTTKHIYPKVCFVYAA